jgi:dihydrodipicolinate synthase/N-acetylneuraminate lyase
MLYINHLNGTLIPVVEVVQEDTTVIVITNPPNWEAAVALAKQLQGHPTQYGCYIDNATFRTNSDGQVEIINHSV